MDLDLSSGEVVRFLERYFLLCATPPPGWGGLKFAWKLFTNRLTNIANIYLCINLCICVFCG